MYSKIIEFLFWKFFKTSKEQIMIPATDEIPKKETYAGSVKRYRPRA